MIEVKQNDFYFIVDLVNDFTNQREIRNKLNEIEKYKLTGWEIWFQIEFIIFLKSHYYINEVEREKVFKRKPTALLSENISIDFVIQKKYSKDKKWIALELKQHNRMSTCIKKMLEDVGKINRLITNEKIKIRSFLNIGIHKYEKEKELNIFDKYKPTDNLKCLTTVKIKRTNFAFTIF